MEDKIIKMLIIEDGDFVPSRGSLYETMDAVPLYDSAVSSKIVWKRPNDYVNYPAYCRDAVDFPMVVQGR